ncbi:MAG: hypothetical protein ABI824_20050 [Acidobacteriota bacterium]
MPAPRHYFPGLIALVIGLTYVSWVLYQREQPTTIELKRKAKEAKTTEWYRATYGTDELTITQFIARTYEIHTGETALLCYGVLNAKTVRLEPAVELLHPSTTYCFNVTPAKTTTYKLIAASADGKTVDQSLTIAVR